VWNAALSRRRSGSPDELLERIRDIRASERRMYLRVREIFALGEGGTPLNNSVGMKGDRTIRKGLCGDQ
jgi:hypothetical protein